MVKANRVRRTRGEKKSKSRDGGRCRSLGNMGYSAQDWGLRVGGGVIILLAAFWLGWAIESNKRDQGDTTARLDVDRSHFIELATPNEPTEPSLLLPRQEKHELEGDGGDEGRSFVSRQPAHQVEQLFDNLARPSQPETRPIWKTNAVPVRLADGPKIVIVIDDLGLDMAKSRAVVDLPGPLTLAILPYAKRANEVAALAQFHGHEILVHLPMEPTNPEADPGPNALYSGQNLAEWQRRILTNFDRFSGYVGFNNHMGSRFTEETAGMNAVMLEALARGLLYLDSRTSAKSVGARVAKANGVPHAVRDVFLDHIETDKFIQEQLIVTEKIARETGIAIAIGHPKTVTIDALSKWLPTLPTRGFQMVPISAAVSL